MHNTVSSSPKFVICPLRSAPLPKSGWLRVWGGRWRRWWWHLCWLFATNLRHFFTAAYMTRHYPVPTTAPLSVSSTILSLARLHGALQIWFYAMSCYVITLLSVVKQTDRIDSCFRSFVPCTGTSNAAGSRHSGHRTDKGLKRTRPSLKNTATMIIHSFVHSFIHFIQQLALHF